MQFICHALDGRSTHEFEAVVWRRQVSETKWQTIAAVNSTGACLTHFSDPKLNRRIMVAAGGELTLLNVTRTENMQFRCDVFSKTRGMSPARSLVHLYVIDNCPGMLVAFIYLFIFIYFYFLVACMLQYALHHRIMLIIYVNSCPVLFNFEFYFLFYFCLSCPPRPSLARSLFFF